MYTKKYIDVITLALVSLIFILLNVYQFQIQDNIQKLLNQAKIQEEIQLQDDIDISETSNTIQNGISSQTNMIANQNSSIGNQNLNQLAVSSEDNNPLKNDNNHKIIMDNASEQKYPERWNIIIPDVNLVAPISEGTSQEVLNKTVGHFEESPLLYGNVCLAAHNRGYNVNYFEELKDLPLNSFVVYQYGNVEIVYAVSNKVVIKETDWSYIENNTDENMITLITCVENQPEYRLCVQAKEIK